MNWHADHGFKVTIAGGSISGLCVGIALRGIGTDVNVYERIGGTMETRGAGIVVQGELSGLLRDHGGPVLPMTSCSGRRYLDPDGGAGLHQDAPQQFTSWEAIYRSLRMTFPDDRYHTGSPILETVQRDRRVMATLQDGSVIESDLFVAADGSSSVMRRRLLPDVQPNYAGYVAWRGTLDEADAPADLVAFFDDTFTFSEARAGGHSLVYFIPGAGMDVHPGKRLINWVWYVRVNQADLDATLVDSEGRQHRSSLPHGLTPAATVAGLRDRALRELHPKMAALIAATAAPYLQTIVDVVVPKTVFGRIALSGDAAFVVRPHTGGATAKAAYDASVLAACLARARKNVDVGLMAAERQQIEYGDAMVRHGIALGDRWTSKVISEAR